MGDVIVIQFVTVDGVVEDPDGSQGTAAGGWMFRHGPEAVGGDKFRLGSILDSGVMLLGRQTWELFARLWPTRTDPFAIRMNKVPKLVASRSLDRVDAWDNSSLLTEPLAEGVRRVCERRDVVVAGSTSVVRALVEDDLVDEYRLITFPVVLGQGTRLFDVTSKPRELDVASVEQTGPLTLTRYRRA